MRKPAIVRKHNRRFVVGLVAVFLILPLTGMVVNIASDIFSYEADVLNQWLFYNSLYIIGTWLVLFVIVQSMLHERPQRRIVGIVRASRFLACEHCAYDLSGVAPAGNCPECGKSYTHEDCRRKWMAYMS
jgi:hypothetical protein